MMVGVSITRELGVHVDGFIAVVGHTTVVGASKVYSPYIHVYMYIHVDQI